MSDKIDRAFKPGSISWIGFGLDCALVHYGTLCAGERINCANDGGLSHPTHSAQPPHGRRPVRRGPGRAEWMGFPECCSGFYFLRSGAKPKVALMEKLRPAMRPGVSPPLIAVVALKGSLQAAGVATVPQFPAMVGAVAVPASERL